MLRQVGINLFVGIQKRIHPGYSRPPQGGLCTIHVTCHLHFRSKKGSIPISLVVPHAGGINQTLNPKLIGIKQHANKGIHIIDFSVCSNNCSRNSPQTCYLAADSTPSAKENEETKK